MQLPMFVRPSEVREVTGILSRSRAYELEKSDPRFPKRVWVSGVSGWATEDLLEYILSFKDQGVSD